MKKKVKKKVKKKKVKRRKNTRTPKQVYKDFRGYDNKNAKEENFDIEDGLACLGTCDGIMYVSDKWDGYKDKNYIHEFKKPLPKLYANAKGNILVIKGNFKVLPAGITG